MFEDLAAAWLIVKTRVTLFFAVKIAPVGRFTY
jgi:hypothetical protein